MKVPCSECIVKATCMHKVQIEKQKINPAYRLENLLIECDMLREFFGFDTPTMRIKLKKSLNRYRTSVLELIEQNPDGNKKLDAFLRTMHKPETPPKTIKIKGPKKRKVKK